MLSRRWAGNLSTVTRILRAGPALGTSAHKTPPVGALLRGHALLLARAGGPGAASRRDCHVPGAAVRGGRQPGPHATVCAYGQAEAPSAQLLRPPADEAAAGAGARRLHKGERAVVVGEQRGLAALPATTEPSVSSPGAAQRARSDRAQESTAQESRDTDRHGHPPC